MVHLNMSNTETSEDLVKRLMSEIRAHGKAMEASSSSVLPYSERRDSGPGREEVRDVDIYDNNATFVIRKPVDRKSDHTFLTVNSSGGGSNLVNGKVSSSTYQNNNHHHQQQTPILSTFLSRPSPSNQISTSLTNKYTGPSSLTTTTTTTTPSSITLPPLISRNYVPPQIIATTSSGTNGLTSQHLTTIANGGVNLIKGESDVSCYSSISSTAAAAADQLIRGSRQIKTSTGQLMCESVNDPHCPSCGVHFVNSDSDPVSGEQPFILQNGVSIKSTGRSQVNGDRLHHSHGHSVVKCDLIGSPDDPPRYSPCRLYNGQANGYHNSHHHHHHHHLQDRIGSKVILSLPKVPLITNNKSNNQEDLINGKKSKTKMPLKYIKKVQRCPGCSGKCYIEPVHRSVNHLSFSSGDNQLFTLYCPSCSKTGLARFRGPAENGNYILNGTIDKHLTYYSALPRLWDTEMWHRKRKRAILE